MNRTPGLCRRPVFFRFRASLSTRAEWVGGRRWGRRRRNELPLHSDVTSWGVSGKMLWDVGHDMDLTAVVGYRSALIPNSKDTARLLTEPVLAAWGLEYVVIEKPADLPRMAEHLQACRDAGKPGVVLIAEGRM